MIAIAKMKVNARPTRSESVKATQGIALHPVRPAQTPQPSCVEELKLDIDCSLYWSVMLECYRAMPEANYCLVRILPDCLVRIP